jgi:hypothetical protein
MKENEMDATHIGPERLSAFLDNDLSPRAREEVVAHFAQCAECRREMTATRELLRQRSKRRAWYLAPPLLVAVAASIALVVVPSVRRVNNEPRNSIRSSSGATATDVRQSIETIAPTNDALLPNDTTRFVWRSIVGGATYRLTIQDSTGTTIWSTSAEDTTAILPDTVRLTPGEYFWSVAARLPDASSAKTGAHRFVVR